MQNLAKQSSGLGMFSDLPEVPNPQISKADFARQMGLTRGRVSQLCRQGLPVLDNGRFDFAAACSWVDNNLSPIRRKAGLVSDKATDQLHPQPDNPLDSLTDLKKENERVKLERARLALAKEEGELVERATIERVIFSRARTERDALLAWVHKTAPILAGKLGAEPSKTFQLLDGEIRDYLSRRALGDE